MLYTKLLAIFTLLPLALGASSHGRHKRACPAKEPVTLPTANTSQPFNYGVDKVRGVNLGGVSETHLHQSTMNIADDRFSGSCWKSGSP